MIGVFLPGATQRDQMLAGLGALAGIAVTYLVTRLALGPGPLPLLVAPMGASAVLIFAVPASPLAQPWSVIGGNTVSALVGVIAARLIGDVTIAAAVAVGGAIAVMSLLRCLHPPGGAAALTAVIGGPVVAAAGLAFPFTPVALNAVLLTLAGLAFHRFSGHSYPHRPVPVAPPDRHPEDLDAALADMHEAFDIDREDLEQLLARVEHHAAERRRLKRKGPAAVNGPRPISSANSSRISRP
jgi:CBS domain-containing membrane protein